jgi:glycosyltransferase involved in cell wall biosynthesis
MTELVVVTVVKNDLNGLRETLKSFAEQSATARLIVIDGFSTDGTFEEIQQWQSKLNCQVIQANDNGPYAAMNRAIDMLNEEDYVWFMNAGDLFGTRDSIKNVKTVFLDTEFNWAYGSFSIMEASGVLREIPHQSAYSIQNHAYGRTPICHQAVITRVRDLREVGEFDVRFPIAADYRALLLLGQKSRPYIFEEVLAQYRAGGISDRTIYRNLIEQRRIRVEVLGTNPSILFKSYIYDTKRILRLCAGTLMSLLVRKRIISPNWRANSKLRNTSSSKS